MVSGAARPFTASLCTRCPFEAAIPALNAVAGVSGWILRPSDTLKIMQKNIIGLPARKDMADGQ